MTGIASCSVRDAIASVQCMDVITPVPLARWDVDAQAGSAARFGGFLQNLDMFDASLFGLSMHEAEQVACLVRMTSCYVT